MQIETSGCAEIHFARVAEKRAFCRQRRSQQGSLVAPVNAWDSVATGVRKSANTARKSACATGSRRINIPGSASSTEWPAALGPEYEFALTKTSTEASTAKGGSMRIVKTVFLVWLTSLLLGAEVRVWQGTLTLPTYQEGLPDTN